MSCLESRIRRRLHSSEVSSRITTIILDLELAACILLDFNRALPRFVKVMPTDYKRVLSLEEAAKAEEATEEGISSLPILPSNPVRQAHEESKKAQHEHETKEKKKNDLSGISRRSVGDAKAEKKRSALVLDKTRGFMKYQRRSEKYRGNPKTPHS